MKRSLIFLCIVALAAWAAWAQEKKDAAPSPKSADDGPNLEVTMKFIQEKLSAKSGPEWKIVADPATCILTEGRHHDPGPGNSTFWEVETTLPFREVAKIEVIPAQEYYRQAGLEQPDNLSANTSVLRVSTTTVNSVHTHERKVCKKGRCMNDDAGRKVESRQSDSFKGEWSTGFDEDLANRVAKAMLHAVELCGGGSKPEPF
jgi:hypothetical protein